MKYVVFFFFIFLTSSILSLAMQGQQFSDNPALEQEAAKWYTYQHVTTEESWGMMSIPGFGWNMLKDFPKMLAWDYSFLKPDWDPVEQEYKEGTNMLGQYVRFLVCVPLSAGFVFMLVSMFIGIFQRTLGGG